MLRTQSLVRKLVNAFTLDTLTSQLSALSSRRHLTLPRPPLSCGTYTLHVNNANVADIKPSPISSVSRLEPMVLTTRYLRFLVLTKTCTLVLPDLLGFLRKNMMQR